MVPVSRQRSLNLKFMGDPVCNSASVAVHLFAVTKEQLELSAQTGQPFERTRRNVNQFLEDTVPGLLDSSSENAACSPGLRCQNHNAATDKKTKRAR